MFTELTPVRKLMLLNAIAGPKAVEYTASGNPVVFETNIAKPLRRLSLSLLPRQSGTGDPSPSNIRPLLPWGEVGTWTTGGNLIDDSKRYLNAAATSYFFGATSSDYEIPLKAGTYTISVEFDDNYGLYYKEENSAAVAIWSAGKDTREKTFTIEGGVYRFYAYNMATSGGIDPEKVHKIMLNVGSTALPYVPYTPITPHPVNLGKNLLPNKTVVYGNNLVIGNDENSANIPLTAGTYTFSVYSSKAVALIYRKSGGDLINIKSSGGNTGLRKASFTLTEDAVCEFMVYISGGVQPTDVSWFQLESGNVDAPVYQPYIPPVYGCELVFTSEGIQVWGTYAIKTFNGSERWAKAADAWNTDDTGFCIQYSEIKNSDNVPIPMCNLLKIVTNFSLNHGEIANVIASSYNLRLRTVSSYSLEDFKAFLAENPLTIAYKLSTPVLLATLTPQQVSAIVGVNTVWSDADGVDVTYLKKG